MRERKKQNLPISEPSKLSFNIEGESKTISDKEKLREFITGRFAIQFS